MTLNKVPAKRFSFIERFRFKNILVFCLIFIAFDVFKLVQSVFIKSSAINQNETPWFPFTIGLLIFFWATTFKYKEEKIATCIFGISFILSSWKIFGQQIILTFAILLEIVGTYYFWLANGIYLQKSIESIDKRKLLIVFIFFLMPPFLIWLIALIKTIGIK